MPLGPTKRKKKPSSGLVFLIALTRVNSDKLHVFRGKFPILDKGEWQCHLSQLELGTLGSVDGWSEASLENRTHLNGGVVIPRL